jgi:hypothetical protein
VLQKHFGKILLGLLGLICLLAFLPQNESEPSPTSQPSPTDPNFDASPAAVAERASQSDVTVPDDVPPGYYPPAPSKAVGMTPEWRRFADTVDRICGLTYNYMQAQEARTWREARVRGWSRAQAIAADWRVVAAQGTQILQATARLGKPPAEVALFRSWRANVALRRDLKLRASAAASRGDWRGVEGISSRIEALKNRSDELGQRFGLRICTSN